VGLVRLGTRSGLGTGLIFVGVLILFIAVGIYYQFGRSLGDDREGTTEGPGPIRLFRMALIWYILSLVLSVSFVRGPLQLLWHDEGKQIRPLEWGMGLLGVGVVGVALWRIMRVVENIKNINKTNK
jgi:membrane protease YdiL (CAAX protease family)